MGDLQQDQQGLRDRLKKLQQELAKRGMGAGPARREGRSDGRAGPGPAGRAGRAGGDGEDGLGQADSAMGDAGGKLGEGNADGAVDSQGKALEALRKGAQKPAPKRCSRATARGRATARAIAPAGSRAAAISSDPLGRPLHGREFGDDFTVKIPGEIDVQRARRILEELRRRLADPQRPQIELDYLERLLKDY